MVMNNPLKLLSKILCIKLFCLCRKRRRIIVLALPYFPVEIEESLLKALICFLWEKSPCNAIDIHLKKPPFCESEHWYTRSHSFEWCDTCIFFLWHEETTCIHIYFHHFFIWNSSEEFDILSCDFLKLGFLCTITDNLERGIQMSHDANYPVYLLEWCESARHDIILSLWNRNWSESELRSFYRRPKNNRISSIILLNTFLYLYTICDIEGWSFRCLEINLSQMLK